MAEPGPFRIRSLRVTGLWGERDLELKLHPDVNILIGPNGSGKTTLLNLLRYTITADIFALSGTEFEAIELHLAAFRSRSTRKVLVESTDTGHRFKIGRRAAIDVATPDYMGTRYLSPRARREFEIQMTELGVLLRGLVPATWLPVSRRLPIPDEEGESLAVRRRNRRLESVDHRLIQLITSLSEYRLRLEARLTQRYKAFEQAILSAMLGSDYDVLGNVEAPTLEEKEQLVRAFVNADLMGPVVQKRIDTYFDAAQVAAEQYENDPTRFTLQQLEVLPLIPRTKAMAALATELEKDRTAIFEALRRFERIANGYFLRKKVSVADSGELVIRQSGAAKRTFQPEELSSGEKQLLILLIEALLREGEPVVYVADEPELSLHIEWQEKLIGSLVELAGQVQVIVATHSPDIAGAFQDRIIRLSGSE